MNAKEQAEIWRRAAQVVAGMDPRMQQMAAGNFEGQLTYSATQAAAWDGYRSAATVLRSIASEYEKAASDEAERQNHAQDMSAFGPGGPDGKLFEKK